MSKRKRSDDYEDLYNQIKKIEQKLRDKTKRRRRVRVISSSSTDSSPPPERRSEQRDRITLSPEPASCHAEPESAAEPPPPHAHEATDDCVTPVEEETPLITVDDVTPELDADLLEILGIDPTKTVNLGKEIQKDVAVRFEHSATAGLSKDDRKELTSKYLIPSNCKLIGAPALNPEIKAALSETVLKRDKVIESKQKLLASAVSSLGEAITKVLSSKDRNTDLLRLLVDTGRMLCDCQHNDTVARRNFIIFSVKKEMKESLQNTKIEDYLFGNNLSDTLKTAKAINKSGSELKIVSAPKPTNIKKNLPSTSKNWKSSNPPRVHPPSTTLKTRDRPATSSATKGPRTSSSRPSQSQRGAHSRR